MKRHLYLFVLLLAAIFLGACGPSNVEPESTETPKDPALQEPTGAEEDVVPRVTMTPMAEGYPMKPTPAPLSEGYPQPEVLPAYDPYPGLEVAGEGQVWVIIPAGKQCEDGLTYATAKDAVTSLETAGIQVHESQTIELAVMAVCGGPTSTHYTAKIDADQLGSAETIGWRFAK